MSELAQPLSPRRRARLEAAAAGQALPSITGPAASTVAAAGHRAGTTARAERVFTHGVLIIVVITLVAPFFFVLSASLKDSTSLFAYPPQWLPLPLYLGNFEHILFETSFPRWMFNTLLVASTVTLIKVFLDSMAGYALAKLQFTGKRFVFLLMLVLLMVPFGVILIPLWTIAHGLHITNTYLALILPPLANPLGVFLMRQFILALPNDLENAARLDGVSEFGIYRRIILPLVKPGLVVLAVIIFTDSFMSFIWPLVATQNDDLQVLTTGVASFRARGGVNYGLWSAAAVMSLVPIAIFFFALQRQFLARDLAGALKQ
jgi:ABC-type glycerol-3-phosphate transport system permease component